MKKKTVFRLILGLLAVLFLAAGGFVLWALDAAQPMPEALQALQPDQAVVLETGRWTSFTPANARPSAGLILYPGGRVDWRAYAPAARSIAACGYRVVIAPMPLNLAVFGKDRAGEIIPAYPEVTAWAVGGHSLGGAMAAQFVHDHPDLARGLILWAAYPAENASLAGSGLRVLSVSGTQDGLATPAKIEASRALLPADMRWLAIQGGNHAGFGWYGSQAGDQEAAISRDEQQAQVVASTCEFMNSLLIK